MDSYPKKSPFLEEVRQLMRAQHYAIRTEQSYVDWIRRYILFHDKRHPRDMGEAEVTAYLTHLSVNRNVAPATQGQALNALVFLYRKVLNQPLGEMPGIVRARKKEKIPVVLTRAEVADLLSGLEHTHWLVACLLYGSGLRLMECIRLRVKDIDFNRLSITVRSGKGGKDRVVTLAKELIIPLQRHLESVKTIHERDISEGYGSVYMPYALARKYPSASTSWGWQYVFPATRRSVDPRSQKIRRHHMDETTVQKAVKIAARKAGINRTASCHTLRHSFIYRMYGMPFLQEQKTAATHLTEIVVPGVLPLTTLVRPEHRTPMSLAEADHPLSAHWKTFLVLISLAKPKRYLEKTRFMTLYLPANLTRQNSSGPTHTKPQSPGRFQIH